MLIRRVDEIHAHCPRRGDVADLFTDGLKTVVKMIGRLHNNRPHSIEIDTNFEKWLAAKHVRAQIIDQNIDIILNLQPDQIAERKFRVRVAQSMGQLIGDFHHFSVNIGR